MPTARLPRAPAAPVRPVVCVAWLVSAPAGLTPGRIGRPAGRLMRCMLVGVARSRNALIAGLLAHAARLRFPVLAAITAGLFLVDLLVPDPIPLVDELLLGLAAALFSSWRRRRSPDQPPAPQGPGS